MSIRSGCSIVLFKSSIFWLVFCLYFFTYWERVYSFCSITNCRKRGFRQHTSIISQFPWVRNLGKMELVLCSGSQKNAIKVSAGLWAPLRLGSVPSPGGCWQNSLPCSCRAHGSLVGSKPIGQSLWLIPSLTSKSYVKGPTWLGQTRWGRVS